jgi:hypothetical protein
LKYLEIVILWKEIAPPNSPANLIQWNIIQTSENIPLHFSFVLGARERSVSPFPSTPILLDCVALAVKFGIELANVTTALYQLLKSRLLIHKIRLTKEQSATATVCHALCTFETFAFSFKPTAWPQTSFSYNLLHSFKVSRIVRMIVIVIKVLDSATGKNCWTHFDAILIMGPSLMWSFWHPAS